MDQNKVYYGVYIIAILQFIGFAFFSNELKSIYSMQTIANSDIMHHHLIAQSYLIGAEYLDKNKFVCFNIDKDDKGTLHPECLCFYSQKVNNIIIQIPYSWHCKSIPKQWKLGGIFN